MNRRRVLLLTEATHWGSLARAALEAWGARVEHVPWSWGDPRGHLDASLHAVQGEIIIAFKADCVVPEDALERGGLALNFHPGPPWWRGVACPERALRRGDAVYGVTAHHMLPEVDRGKILDVRTFAIRPSDTAPALRQRIGVEMLSQLERVWEALSSLPPDPGVADPIWVSDMLTTAGARQLGLL